MVLCKWDSVLIQTRLNVNTTTVGGINFCT